MSAGRLIAVVGPSGVGKDSVMEGIAGACPEIHLVRRVLTRAPELGGEDYTPVSDAQFEDLAEAGAFCVHWQAHGLRYGIPADVLTQVRGGTTCLANFSRSALPIAAAVFPDMAVLNITARPETLAARLASRGRESADEIAGRLAQADKPLPAGLRVITLANDGALDETIDRAVATLALMPEPQEIR